MRSRRTIRSCSGAVASIALLVACTSSGASLVTSAPKGGCRTQPLANVHNVDRLRVLKGCLTVTGTVRRVVINPHDGDANFDLQTDPAFGYTIAPGNVARLQGWLHVEVVPADQAGCTPGTRLPDVNGLDVGTCSGAAVPVPMLGERVRVTGAYVLDGTNAWHEIHPAWEVLPLASTRRR